MSPRLPLLLALAACGDRLAEAPAPDAVRLTAYIKVVSTDSYINSLSEGKYCVAWGYSGDIFFARDLAKESNAGTIVYNVPKEGSQL